MVNTYDSVAEGTKVDYKGKGVAYEIESSQNRESEMGLYPFTKEQYGQIVNLLKNMRDNNNAADSSANLSGMIQSSACSNKNRQEWIVDSVATNHMVAEVNLIDKHVTLSRGVYLPNGAVAKVTHTGRSSVTSRTSLINVLHVPQFKFNLMYVSKLTKELGCSVIFFPGFFLFQDLSTRRVREIGREKMDYMF